MVNPPFVNGSFYHVYNRGVEKRKMFLEKRDYLRFLEAVDYYRKSPQPMKLSDFRRGVVRNKKLEDQTETVRVYCYCLMPNHFHFLIQQLEDGGITNFLRKITDSYSRFFNTKYERVGSLVQGVFKAKIVEHEEYLLQLSKYIHRNSFPLGEWEGKVYPYSSYQNYLTGEVHDFCDTSFILSHFSKNNPSLNYKSFVEESEVDENIYPLLIDEDE